MHARAALLLTGLLLVPAAAVALPGGFWFSYAFDADGALWFLGTPPVLIMDCDAPWTIDDSATFTAPDDQRRLGVRGTYDGVIEVESTEDGAIVVISWGCPGSVSLRAPAVAPALPSEWTELHRASGLAPYATAAAATVAAQDCARMHAFPLDVGVPPDVPFTGDLDVRVATDGGQTASLHSGTYLAGVGPWHLAPITALPDVGPACLPAASDWTIEIDAREAFSSQTHGGEGFPAGTWRVAVEGCTACG